MKKFLFALTVFWKIQPTIFFLAFAFQFSAKATDLKSLIILEMGDQHRPPSGTSRVWIQNSKVVVAKKENGVLQIKSQALGESLVKFNHQTAAPSVSVPRCRA